jgi:uncharacterized membrane protein
LSIAGVFLAKAADNTELGQFVPEISRDSIETLLSVISSSMLVIATFSVASMVSAYASASGTATPRTFSLVISDDVSQNALSAFIGAFIFSIVALIALQNGFYNKAGRFSLFALTITVFTIVIFTFVRWVDSVARLGRLGTTIDKVEDATASAFKRRRNAPTLGGVPVKVRQFGGQAVYGDSIGYVQRIDIIALQKYAEKSGTRIIVAALPGTFCGPERPIAQVVADSGDLADLDKSTIIQAFIIGDDRIFDEDPRFGLIVLSEIASRALSPAVNDPGTAIDIIGTFVRLFAHWHEPVEKKPDQVTEASRVEVPELSLWDMFDDAFTAIARDGAGAIEVAGRLQKALASLASIDDETMRDVAIHHAQLALARAENALDFPEDVKLIQKLAQFSEPV